MHNYKITNCDTDSVSFTKIDNSDFNKEEIKSILNEVNSLAGKDIVWEDDGYYKSFIVLKAKNYIMDTGDKVIYKGSSLKSSKLEPALKEFQKAIIKEMLDNTNNFLEVYHKYVKEAVNLTDIKRWASKKTISTKVLAAEGVAQQNILEALKGTEYSEGDKVYLYYKSDGKLSLIQNFDGDYNIEKTLERVYKTALIFKNVIPAEEMFKNYKLKRNKALLGELL